MQIAASGEESTCVCIRPWTLRFRVMVSNDAAAVWFAAVHGTTTAGTCDPLTATGTSLLTATTTTAFVLPELMDLLDGKCLTRSSS